MTKEILIAESDKTVQKELERIFEITDYEIIFSENDEALLRAKLFRPDLIIGGKEVCQTVKGDPEFREIPFILLLNPFEDLSEKEQKSLKVDGIISRPLNGDEVLNSVDRVMEIGSFARGRDLIGEKSEECLFPEKEKSLEKGDERFTLGEVEDEEIIELVDVIEEPETKMSITDFAIPPREEPLREISSLEPWTKEEKPPERRLLEREFEEEISLQPEEKGEFIEKEEWIERREPEEKPKEEEFFETVELEEILQKVERLEPLIEKEGLQEVAKKEEKIEEESFQPPLAPEAPEEAISEESLSEIELEELSEEEFPEAFLEELEEELEELEEEAIEEVPSPELPSIEEVEKEIIQEAPEIPIQKPIEVTPSMVPVEKSIEEIISKGIGEMMQDFMRKIIPEITQHLMTQTLNRIEKMVQEIVPELAEKAIQEELKRLEKEEKE